ncbi:hypothetical protein D3C81_1128890 [compost metagenome]
MSSPSLENAASRAFCTSSPFKSFRLILPRLTTKVFKRAAKASPPTPSKSAAEIMLVRRLRTIFVNWSFVSAPMALRFVDFLSLENQPPDFLRSTYEFTLKPDFSSMPRLEELVTMPTSCTVVLPPKMLLTTLPMTPPLELTLVPNAEVRISERTSKLPRPPMPETICLSETTIEEEYARPRPEFFSMISRLLAIDADFADESPSTVPVPVAACRSLAVVSAPPPPPETATPIASSMPATMANAPILAGNGAARADASADTPYALDLAVSAAVTGPTDAAAPATSAIVAAVFAVVTRVILVSFSNSDFVFMANS